MVDTSAQVLGISYFGPVAGSPLVPPEVITIYFFIFFAVLAILYYVLHKRRKPVLLWHKVKLLVVVAVLLKLTFIGGGSLLAAYWLLPKPNVQSTAPAKDTTNFDPKNKIEILFDRPISRRSLQKSISPDVPGVWVFDLAFYTTHFYRKVTFYPTQTLTPNTTYTITLKNIKNPLRISKPYAYSFAFKTQPSPHVVNVTPVSGTDAIAITTPLTISLSDPNDGISEFAFELDPNVPFVTKLDTAKKQYTLIPTTPLQQGTKYTLTVKKTDIVMNIPTNTVIQRGNVTQEYQGTFTTKEAPGIAQFTPSEEKTSPDTPITISFSQPMDRKSVEKNFSITPSVLGSSSWTDNKTFTFTPLRLAYETTYTIKLAKGTKSQGEGFFEQDVVKSFSTIGHVKVAQFSPSDGLTAIGMSNQIRITFDQGVDKNNAQSKFAISPHVDGTFSWDGNTMIFTPTTPYAFSTKYTVTVAKGVKAVKGLDSNDIFTTNFFTQEGTIKLSVPVFLQQHALSCEVAALRMALAFKGKDVSEETLLAQVGVDNTPHNGNVWGNPYNAFVGNVDGRQMADGYGVYWNPIARVARNYRNAQDFQGWDIAKLTHEIANGNAVVLWTYSSGGWPTNWVTPDGKNIVAFRDEHAVTAVGFVGPASNPSQIIINDPLHGQVYWERGFFDTKWKSFNNAGVVVY